MNREAVSITDTGASGESPYAGYCRQGASIVPRCLFFVNETENTAIIQAGQTITVNPRRGSQDKAPWKDLDLTAISNQTIERSHLFDVHLGETIAPYVTLEPLKALLPLKQGEYVIPVDPSDVVYGDPVADPVADYIAEYADDVDDTEYVGGIGLDSLEQRMRQRWQTISQMWEGNKEPVNKLNLAERLDYYGELSSQLGWQAYHSARPLRVAYTAGGQPTAALLTDDAALVDERLYWITCKGIDEANYLLAIINSGALAVQPLMTKGQFGARHLRKHLWKMAIPEFDPKQKLHVVIAKAGERAAAGAAQKLAEVREDWGGKFTVAIARRELRAWLRSESAPEGKEVEAAVAALLGQGVDYRGTITIEADKRFGKPCIRGIRMTVQDVMEYLAGGDTWAGLLEDFDNLTEADMYVCLSFAAAEKMDDDYSRLRYAVI